MSALSRSVTHTPKSVTHTPQAKSRVGAKVRVTWSGPSLGILISCACTRFSVLLTDVRAHLLETLALMRVHMIAWNPDSGSDARAREQNQAREQARSRMPHERDMAEEREREREREKERERERERENM
eukprot:364609-Chlamydomonas_euryale.AAC.5